MKLVFATNNRHKLEEIRDILGDRFEIVSLSQIGCHEDIPEDHETLQENALQKARFVKEHYGYDCFADDTGLEIEVLENRPGVYSARYAGPAKRSEDNVRKVLKEMEGKTNRKAQFRTVIALVMNRKEYCFEGKVLGEILTEQQGTAGFGYDHIPSVGFYRELCPDGKKQKNGISHRGRAVEKLTEFLNKTVKDF